MSDRGAGLFNSSRRGKKLFPIDRRNLMPPNPPSPYYRVEYVAFCAASALMSALPLEVASRFAGRLVRTFGPLSRRRHRRLVDNLTNAYPSLGEAECKALALGVWENLGRIFAEFFHLDAIARDRIVCDNPEFLEQLARSSRGCVGCAAHQANWEVAAAVAVKHGLQPLGVYHPISNPFVNAAAERRRARFYPGGLLPKRDPATPAKILRAVRNGAAAAFLADQNMHTGPAVSFFGRDARTTTFPASISRALDVPLFVMHVTREPGVRFRVRCEPIEAPRTADRDADVLVATAAIQAAIEKMVRRQPDQWMWIHRRWG